MRQTANLDDCLYCETEVKARGLCKRHYGIHSRRGTLPPLTVKPKAIKKPRGTGRPTGRPRSWTQEDLERAKMLLEDGASYHEVARSTPIPRTTLREQLPNMGWSLAEGGQFIQSLTRNPQMRTMYEEIRSIRDGI